MFSVIRINLLKKLLIQQIYPASYLCFASNVPKFLRYNCKNLVTVSNKSIMQIKRYKYKKPQKTDRNAEYYSDSDSESDDEEDASNSKLLTGRMQSLRLDSVLKAGLGIARNKVETKFYEDKITVNGEKVPKKGAKLEVGDEIDVLESNAEDSLASRVVIVSVKVNEDEDGYIVKLKRYKNIKIDR